MALRPVSEYIRLLDGVSWFERVGEVEDESVSAVKSWAEAQVYICDQLVWLNFRNAVSNRHRELWRLAYPDGRHQAALAEVAEAVQELVRARNLKRIDENLTTQKRSPSASFLYHVVWNLNFAGFEFVCQDDAPPLFFLPLALPWYRRGHFPCGWQGTMIRAKWPGNSPEDLPKGRLRVL